MTAGAASALEAHSADGTRIACTRWGPDDAPVVVLVHGLGMSTGSWGRVPELLAAAHRVVGWDLRGHGRSDRAARADYTLSAHAADLAAVLRRALPERARAVVAAHSFGGAVVLAHARAEPQHRMAGVVFAGSSGSCTTLPGFPIRRLPGWAEAGIRAAWLQLLRGIAVTGHRVRRFETVPNRLIRRFAFSPQSPEAAVDRVREDFLATRPEALARTALTSASRDGSTIAPCLAVPALVLHGECDPEVDQENLRKLMEALPDGELVRMPGAGHMLPLTHPEAVARQVARWVRRVLPAPSG